MIYLFFRLCYDSLNPSCFVYCRFSYFLQSVSNLLIIYIYIFIDIDILQSKLDKPQPREQVELQNHRQYTTENRNVKQNEKKYPTATIYGL